MTPGSHPLDDARGVRTCGVLLAALAALLPFEVRYPIATVGPLRITALEAALYLVVAAWILMRLPRQRASHWPLLVWAVAGWAATTVLAAFVAPAFRTDAIKFALRSLSGIALFFVAVDLGRSPRVTIHVVAALVAGGVMSALTAPVELWMDGADLWLAVFKTQPSVAGGFLRASGTFQYANTGAMFWEASVPLALGLGASWSVRRVGGALVGGTAALVLGTAIVLSVSRAAFVSTALAVLVLAIVARRTAPAVARASGLVLAGLATLAIVAPTPLVSLRFQTDDQAAWNRATWLRVPPPLSVATGGMTRVVVRLANSGVLAWSPEEPNPVRLGYHVYDAEGRRVVWYDGARTSLPRTIAPGQALTLIAELHAPMPPGRYVVEWDMVREGIAWFGALGAPIARTIVEVLPSPTRRPAEPMAPPRTIVHTRRPARLDLWRAGLTMWTEHPLLGKGPDNFRHLYGPYLGWREFDDRVTANNLYVETAATTGLVGMLALCLVLAAALGAAWRWWRRAPRDDGWLLTVSLALAVGTHLLHGMVDYFLPFTPTLGQFWLLLGLAAAAWHGEGSKAACA